VRRRDYREHEEDAERYLAFQIAMESEYTLDSLGVYLEIRCKRLIIR
jgi:hypothetical protein